MAYEETLFTVMDAILHEDIYTLSRHIDEIDDNNSLRIEGKSLLCLAAHNGKPKAVEFLVSHGADVLAGDSDGDTPLVFAAAGDNAGRSRSETIKTLVRCGALVDSRNNEGITPLMYASGMGFEDAVGTLLDLGANACARDYAGRSVMTYAACPMRTRVPSTRVVELLALSGADLDDLYDRGFCLALETETFDMSIIARSGHPERYLNHYGLTVVYIDPNVSDYKRIFG